MENGNRSCSTEESSAALSCSEMQEYVSQAGNRKELMKVELHPGVLSMFNHTDQDHFFV